MWPSRPNPQACCFSLLLQKGSSQYLCLSLPEDISQDFEELHSYAQTGEARMVGELMPQGTAFYPVTCGCWDVNPPAPWLGCCWGMLLTGVPTHKPTCAWRLSEPFVKECLFFSVHLSSSSSGFPWPQINNSLSNTCLVVDFWGIRMNRISVCSCIFLHSQYKSDMWHVV